MSLPPVEAGAGQTWSNYIVHVEITRDGKTLIEDRTIMLTGGQSQELSFDLGGMQVASKRTSKLAVCVNQRAPFDNKTPRIGRGRCEGFSFCAASILLWADTANSR